MFRLVYKRKTLYLGAADEEAIAAIKERHGLSTDSDAVRFAVRWVAEHSTVKMPVKRRKG